MMQGTSCVGSTTTDTTTTSPTSPDSHSSPIYQSELAALALLPAQQLPRRVGKRTHHRPCTVRYLPKLIRRPHCMNHVWLKHASPSPPPQPNAHARPRPRSCRPQPPQTAHGRPPARAHPPHRRKQVAPCTGVVYFHRGEMCRGRLSRSLSRMRGYRNMKRCFVTRAGRRQIVARRARGAASEEPVSLSNGI